MSQSVMHYLWTKQQQLTAAKVIIAARAAVLLLSASQFARLSPCLRTRHYRFWQRAIIKTSTTT